MVETTLFIPTDHPAFAGHFPGRPIVPGVVLLDAAVHALGNALPAEITAAAVCQVSSAKFLSPVGPGETLTIRCTVPVTGTARFDISSGERKVATGSLAFQPTP